VVPLVAGFNWVYDLRRIQQFPVDRQGTAYTAHAYSQKAKHAEKSKVCFKIKI